LELETLESHYDITHRKTQTKKENFFSK